MEETGPDRMEESRSPKEPKEPKAKHKVKKVFKKSKRRTEKDSGLTSVTGNGEQPDEAEGSEEISTEAETSPSPLHMGPGSRPADLKDRALFGHGSSETEPVAHEGEATAGASKHEDLDTLRTLLGEAEKGTVVWEEEDCEGETAAELFIKGGTERFRSLSSRAEIDVRQALCCMFYFRVELTLRRTSEFLIFLLAEARVRLEEDLEEGERLARMHGEVQQTAIVLVEKLRANDQEMLWSTQAGLEILMKFQLGDARLFFARPSLQQIMLDVWQGVRPDYFQRSWCKQLQVWMWLLMYGIPNLVMVFLWAVAPEFEQYMHTQTISRADAARQEEEKSWHKIRETLEKWPKSNWPYTVESKKQAVCLEWPYAGAKSKRQKKCWDLAQFNKAIREECREQVFLVQCRLPLLIPRYKKYLAILTNLAFAAYLIGETPDEANAVAVLILSAGAWLGEVAQLLSFANSKAGAQNSFSFWFMDRVNVMELIAFTCIAWASVLCLIQQDWIEFAQQFKALGVLFLGISQCMAMLRMSSVFGPLVSMTMNMIVDMIQWVTLLAPIIACLVAALITLFKTKQESDCLPFGSNYLRGVVAFFEVQIGQDLEFECLRDPEKSPHTVTGPLIMISGMWMIQILMLNMLIAMMAKTFDRIYESAMVDFQYQFIGSLLQMVEEPSVPPVLRTLGLPWMMCCTLWRWTKGSREQITKKIWTTQNESNSEVWLRLSSFHAMHREQQQRDAVSGEVKIRGDEDGRPTDHDQCIDLLYKSVTSFISEHASDTQVQDDLWRKQMAQKICSVDMKLETKVDALTTKLDTLTQTLEALLPDSKKARKSEAARHLKDRTRSD
ncbi:Transient receptor potential cation channel trpm (Transient receptor potential cation channel [Durusdinium trenchii]|uniref:Subfamily M ortholog n=1 Tax=Durusdinium trenchii TaxID=1381693 RepID=A0ABP0HVS2_9DINO